MNPLFLFIIFWCLVSICSGEERVEGAQNHNAVGAHGIQMSKAAFANSIRLDAQARFRLHWDDLFSVPRESVLPGSSISSGVQYYFNANVLLINDDIISLKVKNDFFSSLKNSLRRKNGIRGLSLITGSRDENFFPGVVSDCYINIAVESMKMPELEDSRGEGEFMDMVFSPATVSAKGLENKLIEYGVIGTFVSKDEDTQEKYLTRAFAGGLGDKRPSEYLPEEIRNKKSDLDWRIFLVFWSEEKR